MPKHLSDSKPEYYQRLPLIIQYINRFIINRPINYLKHSINSTTGE